MIELTRQELIKLIQFESTEIAPFISDTRLIEIMKEYISRFDLKDEVNT